MFIDRAGKFTYLPGSLLVLIVTGAFVQHIEFGDVVFDVSLSVTLLATPYATSQNRRFFVAGIVPAASTFAAAWLAHLSGLSAYIYDSFTCLTTLGLGDIIPATPQARVFSYLSAVIGQIFLTVLIARIVGLPISGSARQ